MSWITSLLLQLPEGLLLIEKGPLLPGGVDINYKNHPSMGHHPNVLINKSFAQTV